VTVVKLLGLLTQAGCSQSVRECFLELADNAPEDLEAYVELLQSGLRAKLAGKRWFGIDENGRGVGPLVDGALDFHRPLPLATRSLAVEGECDASWDVIDSRANTALADAFDVPRQRAK